METKLVWLNKENGASQYEIEYAGKIKDENPVFCIFGSAYGGGLEALGKLYPKATIYGFDTFTGHPKFLSSDINSFEATCMDYWYERPNYGTKNLSEEYQREVLDSLGLKNVILKKGLISKESTEGIDKIHYCTVDLDIRKSTEEAFEAFNDKLVKGGYVLFHDAVPEFHLPKIHNFVYHMVIGHGYEKVFESEGTYTTVVQKI